MTLKEIREWLKTKTECDNFYIGKIDGSKDKCIGIYNTKGPAPEIAIGGLINTSNSVKSVSILVHWGNNADLAEVKAQEIYNLFFGQSAEIGGKRIISFDMNTSEPVSVGTDTNNIYEYVIDFNIFYER